MCLYILENSISVRCYYLVNEKELLWLSETGAVNLFKKLSIKKVTGGVVIFLAFP